MNGQFFMVNACACLGPQGGDPYCPCRMQREKLDGYYNCYGDKESQARRSAEATKRLEAALTRLAERNTDTNTTGAPHV